MTTGITIIIKTALPIIRRSSSTLDPTAGPPLLAISPISAAPIIASAPPASTGSAPPNALTAFSGHSYSFDEVSPLSRRAAAFLPSANLAVRLRPPHPPPGRRRRQDPLRLKRQPSKRRHEEDALLEDPLPQSLKLARSPSSSSKPPFTTRSATGMGMGRRAVDYRQTSSSLSSASPVKNIAETIVVVVVGSFHHRLPPPRCLRSHRRQVLLAQTLTSPGFARSAFLAPVDAIHGNIGDLSSDELLVSDPQLQTRHPLYLHHQHHRHPLSGHSPHLLQPPPLRHRSRLLLVDRSRPNPLISGQSPFMGAAYRSRFTGAGPSPFMLQGCG